jgi:transcriptional regulator with XRE-family HTH domain
MNNTPIDELLLKYRATHKISQDELALLLGVKQVTIHNWESGKNAPKGEHYGKILEVCKSKPTLPLNNAEASQVKLMQQLLDAKDEIIEALKDKIRNIKEHFTDNKG